MIKIIIGYRVKEGANIEPILMRLRTDAMQYPGFVSAENLISRTDSSIVIIINTWNTAENWVEWEKSEVRAALHREVQPLLQDGTKATIYEVVPTTR